MTCERIRELLLTDYIDGELDEKSRREIDGHLGVCADCRKLREAAAGNAALLRAAAPAGGPPAYIWERVKAAVTAERPDRDVVARTAEGIKEVFAALTRIPRPAFAFAAAAMIIIAVFVSRPSADAEVNAYLAEQMDFMARLDSADANGNGFFDTDLRTGAENIL